MLQLDGDVESEREVDREIEISVLMPVYNGEEYLYDAIKSVLNQTYKNYELLILLEYGSSKKSKEIVYSFDDPRIKVVSNEEKLGLAKSLNRGIKLAKGKYIARMDSDDISYPNRFKIQKDFLDRNTSISLCGTAIKINGRKVVKKRKNHQEIVFQSYFSCPFFHPTVMWRKKVFLENELFYQENIAAEDYELWMRALRVIRTANISKPLLMYRLYGNSRSDKQHTKLVNETQEMIKDYWEQNGMQYNVPDGYQSIFQKQDVVCKEWKLLEVVNHTPDFSHKLNMVMPRVIDAYLQETQNVKKIYSTFCNVFSELFNGKRTAKGCTYVYCVYRVIRRKCSLWVDRIVSRRNAME